MRQESKWAPRAHWSHAAGPGQWYHRRTINPPLSRQPLRQSIIETSEAVTLVPVIFKILGICPKRLVKTNKPPSPADQSGVVFLAARGSQSIPGWSLTGWKKAADSTAKLAADSRPACVRRSSAATCADARDVHTQQHTNRPFWACVFLKLCLLDPIWMINYFMNNSPTPVVLNVVRAAKLSCCGCVLFCLVWKAFLARWLWVCSLLPVSLWQILITVWCFFWF